MESYLIKACGAQRAELFGSHKLQRGIEMDVEVFPEILLQQSDVFTAAFSIHQRISAGYSRPSRPCQSRFLKKLFRILRISDPPFIREDNIFPELVLTYRAVEAFLGAQS